jgi:hypothetical protein
MIIKIQNYSIKIIRLYKYKKKIITWIKVYKRTSKYQNIVAKRTGNQKKMKELMN